MEIISFYRWDGAFAQLWRSIAAKWWLELLKQLITYVFVRDWEKNREPNRVEIVAE